MPKHRHARASLTPKVREAILSRISVGESLSQICGPDRARGLPDRSTVHKWMREDKAFRLAYLEAREAQTERIADDVIDIADGRKPVAGEEPSVGRDWLRVSARQWRVGVMTPRTYGRKGWPREEMEALAEELMPKEPMDVVELGARIAAILEAARVRKAEEEAAEGAAQK